MNIHGDDRRLAYFDVFGEVTEGQVNVVRLYPDAICAWHRHHLQTDHYFCVAGKVKVGSVKDDGNPPVWTILDARHPRTIAIAPHTWHGYMAIGEEATLVQYVDRRYDPKDEERKNPTWMGIGWTSEPR